MEEKYIGVEIGGTKQQLCVADKTGKIIKLITGRFPIPNGAADILKYIKENMHKLLKEFPEVKAIGVGFGGPIETKTGKVLLSVQVKGWQNFELKTWFEREFSLPATVVNDTVAGGYAELILGSGKNCNNFYYTNIGTGIGGAMFLNRRTFDGIGYGGVYMGNTYVNDYRNPGEVCRLEELCSGTGIEALLRSDEKLNKNGLLYKLCHGDKSKLNCKMLGDAARQNDPDALRHIENFAKTYGITIANFITLFSPERIAIGGGVANLGDILINPIRKYAEKYVFASSKNKYDIVKCDIMDENVIVGAVLYAINGFNTI